MINRITIINDIIKSNNLKTLLEIGTQTGAVAKAINNIHKTGVDINKINANNSMYDVFYYGTSDNFFLNNKKRFDITFIDGDHSHQQSLKDLQNALQCTDQFIVMHDALPDNLEYTSSMWCGEVYKTAYMVMKSGFVFKLNHEDHGVLVIDVRNNKPALDTTLSIGYNDYIKFINTPIENVEIKSKRKRNGK